VLKRSGGRMGRWWREERDVVRAQRLHQPAVANTESGGRALTPEYSRGAAVVMRAHGRPERMAEVPPLLSTEHGHGTLLTPATSVYEDHGHLFTRSM